VEGDRRYWDGWTGIDALAGGFLLDSQAIRLTMD